MEFFAEFLLEIYMQLMFLVVPKKKRGNKKYRVIATLIAIAVSLGVMALARRIEAVIERGDYSPSVTLALTIARICGVTVEEIFYLQEETENEK